MTHNIKLNYEFCDDVLSGDKCFEIRYNDRGFQKGDLIKFISVDSSGCKRPHPVDNKTYLITYVLGGWGLKDNFVALGIKESEDEIK